MQEVPREHTKRYGIVGIQGRAYAEVDGIVETQSEDAPSTLGVAGRYHPFSRYFPEHPGAAAWCRRRNSAHRWGLFGLIGHEPVYCLRYKGKRYDCGSKEGFLEATIDLALANAEVSDSVMAHLRSVVQA